MSCVSRCTFVWKVEGTFRVHKPPVLLGYTYDSSSLQGEAVTNEAAVQSHAENTYLTFFVTIEPQLAVPEPFHEKVCQLSVCCLLIWHFFVFPCSCYFVFSKCLTYAFYIVFLWPCMHLYQPVFLAYSRKHVLELHSSYSLMFCNYCRIFDTLFNRHSSLDKWSFLSP